MAYSTPPNFVAGAVLTEANLDVLSDDISFLANPPRCRVYNSANISIPNGVATALTFNSERYDTDTMHSTAVNTGRVTFTTAGLYRGVANVSFASNATGYRQVYVAVGGGNAIAVANVAPVTGALTSIALPWEYDAAAGAYVEVFAFQNSGGALNVNVQADYSPEMSACLVAV